MDTVSLMIRTADAAWTAANAKPGPGPGTAVVTIPAAAAERVTFAGRDMISFDLGQVARRLPADWPNRHATVPLAHHIAGPVPARTASGRSGLEDRNRRAVTLIVRGLSASDVEAQADMEAGQR